MVDWELTATTVFCETVADEVTLMVFADGTCRCTGREKQSRPGRAPACPPADCEIVAAYREKLFREEEPAR